MNERNSRLQVKNEKGEWVQVVVPKSVKAIVLLNLQSYAGGRDLWGLKDISKDQAKGWKVPIFNDGLIEASLLFCILLPQSTYVCNGELSVWEVHGRSWQEVSLMMEAVFQVVGLQGGYHTAAVMGGVNSKVHAKRLAQASEVLIELQGPALHYTAF